MTLANSDARAKALVTWIGEPLLNEIIDRASLVATLLTTSEPGSPVYVALLDAMQRLRPQVLLADEIRRLRREHAALIAVYDMATEIGVSMADELSLLERAHKQAEQAFDLLLHAMGSGPPA